MYEEVQEVSYYCENLLGGGKWYQNVRFVLVWLNGRKAILVSTDLTLTQIEIIELYCHRFKIECAFRELKQIISGFCYRFWNKYMPKLKHFKSNYFHQEQQEKIIDDFERDCIVKTVAVIERYALISCISLGLIQIISIMFSNVITSKRLRFMRTPVLHPSQYHRKLQ